ncbi:MULTISPECIES: SprT family zinc-dependent metalloprotease [Pseudomonas]|uniref:M48 family metallopeptidase n=1 Tax=Pseudomonas TaxID=286 RepID=UPI0018AC073B|nr:SprT family zinc-dependent metalloprotease [Pseudomonas putida]MBF8710012.1 M48 family metallopeptidase [Pseudomonas putida]
MSDERHCLMVGSQSIDYIIVKRPRKTLEIAVEPDASVVVVAPLDANLDAIEIRLRKRATWILRQQRYFAQFLPRTPERQFIAGETHLYLGRQYRLKFIPHVQERVKLVRGFIEVQTHRPNCREVIRELVEAWYRNRAHIKFAERIEVNLQRFPTPEAFRPRDLIVRQMKQRWGSMSPAGRLLLNRRLIEAPINAIDYVITHELCHITEPHHGAAFYELLDRVLPDWERRKQKLESVMA